MDFIVPLNETRPRELPIPAAFFFDHEKYFVSIILLAFFVSTVVGSISMAFYPMILVCMKHICALFQVTGYLFETINDNKDENDVYDNEQQLYAKMLHVIKYHKRAIKLYKNRLLTLWYSNPWSKRFKEKTKP
ncbi:hypothetical protein M0802_006138 [Mischocyttarus mexicanus]|nr:hypothetical protein M0802_006138 [Mischocyttarus mexicanus]